MKRYFDITVPLNHPAAIIACGFMAASALIRLIYYIPTEMSPAVFWIHLILPTAATLLFILGTVVGKGYWKPLSIAAVVLGIAFFIIKAFSFTPVHQTLCTILYLTVLSLYTLTILGYLPTKKLLYLLFGLPLVYHILVEDTQLYFFADPPVPVWEWMPEISVLCIMAALFSQSAAMKTEPISRS